MSEEDHMLAQGTVDFRNEERAWRNGRTTISHYRKPPVAQLDIYSNEIPVGDLTEPVDEQDTGSQIGVDDEWPEDMF